MLTYIKINGFKSFHNFEMNFTPFTVIAGANGSGKSNLLDALQLLKSLTQGKTVKQAFREQRGEFRELFTQYGSNEYATEMYFCLELFINSEKYEYEIKIEQEKNDLVVTYESLQINHDLFINTLEEDNSKHSLIFKHTYRLIDWTFELRSLISFKELTGGDDLISLVYKIRKNIENWNFLQLNPSDLRLPTSKNFDDDILESSGKNLGAILFRLKEEDDYILKEILRSLQKFLPHFIKLDVINDIEGQRYIVKLTDTDKKVYTSRVLSDGTLRILAFCTLLYDFERKGLLCLEEPEIGMHPFQMENLAHLLKGLSSNFSEEKPPKQLIINTHSPLLVGKILELYSEDKAVSIHLARMTRRVTTIKNKKVALSVTKMINPFEQNKVDKTLSPKEKEAQKKFALAKIKAYLSTGNFEELTKEL